MDANFFYYSIYDRFIQNNHVRAGFCPEIFEGVALSSWVVLQILSAT